METSVIKTKNWTRENFIGLDTITNAQYRFGFPGNELFSNEIDAIIKTIEGLNTDYLVISGSLNEGLSSDFYQKIAETAKKSSIKVIVDTSGEALQKVLETGVYLIKPNIGELAKLIGVEQLAIDEVAPAALKLIEKGSAEIVVVSLGPQGAVLVTATQTEFVPAPNVVKKSTVGAGDSMVGAMTWALSQNKSLKEVVQWGVACGSAATMNEGTQLFKLEDARRLFEELRG
jgi:6-phosphofructokinase 2